MVSERFELARNFCNKLWNASRFALMNLEGYTPGTVADDELLVEDRWILSRLATVTQQVTDALAEYRYADAARVLYDFAWDEFCSFYVEMVKGRLQDEPTAADGPAGAGPHARHAAAAAASDDPVPDRGGLAAAGRGGAASAGSTRPQPAAESIMIAPWPESDAARQDPEIEAQFARFQEVLRAVRDIRSRQNVPPKTQIEFSVRCDAATAELLRPMEPYFASMAGARADGLGPGRRSRRRCRANVTLPGMEVYVDLAESDRRRRPRSPARSRKMDEARRPSSPPRRRSSPTRASSSGPRPPWSRRSVRRWRASKSSSPP